MKNQRRLIEVMFPLERVSAESRREKNIRHGHISTLHIWLSLIHISEPTRRS